ncbi:MAG: HNH endonuclease [Pseudomonadota bacterium]
MPTRPKQFTPAHNAPHLRAERERKRKAALDEKREQAHNRGYGWDWRRFRKAVIKDQPYCERCGSTDRLNVDHIISVADRPDLRLDRSNVRVLCQSCHSSRTARDQGFAKRAGQ